MQFSALVVGKDVDKALEAFQTEFEEPPENVDLGLFEDEFFAVAVRSRNAQTDWWEVGGSYEGYLLLHDGSRASTARAGDVDWEGMLFAQAAAAAEIYDAVVAGADLPLQGGLTCEALDAFVKSSRSSADFIARMTLRYAAPKALVVNGGWMERRGSWLEPASSTQGAPDMERFWRCVSLLPSGCHVTIVDCHY